MFGLFVIEAGKEPVAVLDGNGKPLVYEAGKDAAEDAKRFADGNHWANGFNALKCQPRRLASDAWKQRELARFEDGTYISLPWTLPDSATTADHFPHVSMVDGARIAYTQDAAKGAGDIQTRIKPGKYLAQFYGDVFDAPTIAKMAAEFSRDFGEGIKLLFATTEDEIEDVYENGPNSCMAKSVGYFESSIHPVRVYAAGDLAVAYIKRNGDITARALCWPSKKVYGRVYGDDTRLVDLLERASYSAGSLNGARMLRIEEGNGFVVPYIDGCCSAGDEGDHLILGGHGICGSNLNGLSGSGLTCLACGESINEDDCHVNDNGEAYCESCYSDRYTYCERFDEECSIDEMAEVICNSRYGSRGRTTEQWGERARDRYAFQCEGNGNWYSNDFLVTLEDGTQWSQDYFEDHGTICEATDEAFAIDDTVTLEDGTTWSKDHFAKYGVTIDGKLYDEEDAP